MTTVAEAKQGYLDAFERRTRARSASAQRGAAPKWLEDTQRAAMGVFDELGFPGPKNEDWKYTGVTPIIGEPFHTALADAPEPYDAARAAALVRSLSIPVGEPSLVFVNGAYAANLSRATDSLVTRVTLRSLAADLAMPKATDSLAISHFGHAFHPRAHGFAALNTAFADDGAVIWIGEGKEIDKPLHLVFVGASSGKPVIAHVRNLIVADAGSSATVVEHYVGEGVYLTNAATELTLARGATVRHVKVQDDAGMAYHIARSEAELAEHASLESHVVTMGAVLSRSEIDVRLAGRHAECRLSGLYALHGERHADHHTVIDHAVAETKSFENYKGVLDDSSRGVFTGRVIVRRDSQKVEARQQNKNLLLSEGAVVETRPQLEIYADDVQCSHGAAIGQLDESALFYLRQRGLEPAAARGLLTWAFASEILDKLPGEALRSWTTERVRREALGGREVAG